ncbi:uncharacterized protein B0H18DRAFT_882487 [Fomitopsis serialis]|uniref:uncharacterized protein n=1 Tax=Fomitopsis serialis TaxID=139415 RepID=UPI002008518C|nr:uncharacterized protein B0H18DRAFT_882487 [Neoantrodia serialis]KAH9918843.1 hypothetical protein B0H18DRAFT_882487 [Neoantrodia serialis]
MEQWLSAVAGSRTSDDQASTFDYKKVPVRDNAFWVMQLSPVGFQGKDPQVHQGEYLPGSTPAFGIIIYDDRDQFLVQEMVLPGMLSSDVLLKYAIASPLPPNLPCAPSLRVIAYKLSPHVDALRPFLDSLPAPFSWRSETFEEAERVGLGAHSLSIQGVAKAIKRAEEEKQLGNEAIGRKDRTAAIKHYSEAYEFLADAIAQNPTVEQTRDIKRVTAICLANRAAALLLEGEGQDAKKALADAERAATFDENYGKAYHRQAKAHQLLGARGSSIDVLTTALKKPSHASDKDLNDALVGAYGGFPESPDKMRALCCRLFVDKDGDLRARDIKEFVRRADAHVKKISATTL